MLICIFFLLHDYIPKLQTKHFELGVGMEELIYLDRESSGPYKEL